LLKIPPKFTALDVVDWVEISLLFGRESTLSKAHIKDILEESPKIESAETLITNIWQEIISRHIIAPIKYPVKISSTRIERTKSWKQAFCYSFLLLLSGHKFVPEIRIPDAEWSETAKLFEMLTFKALEAHFGNALVVGWPRSDSSIASFKVCLTQICENINEEPCIEHTIDPNVKDEKLDVIAWRTIDNRSGKIIILVNCAAGKNWHDKRRELSRSVWRDYISFPFQPLKAFAFPYVENSKWRKTSLEAGLLLDRLRLTKLIPIHSRFSLRIAIMNWLNNKVDNLPWND